jgi:hypothetical protein
MTYRRVDARKIVREVQQRLHEEVHEGAYRCARSKKGLVFSIIGHPDDTKKQRYSVEIGKCDLLGI